MSLLLVCIYLLNGCFALDEFLAESVGEIRAVFWLYIFPVKFDAALFSQGLGCVGFVSLAESLLLCVADLLGVSFMVVLMLVGYQGCVMQDVAIVATVTARHGFPGAPPRYILDPIDVVR